LGFGGREGECECLWFMSPVDQRASRKQAEEETRKEL